MLTHWWRRWTSIILSRKIVSNITFLLTPSVIPLLLRLSIGSSSSIVNYSQAISGPHNENVNVTYTLKNTTTLIMNAFILVILIWILYIEVSDILWVWGNIYHDQQAPNKITTRKAILSYIDSCLSTVSNKTITPISCLAGWKSEIMNRVTCNWCVVNLMNLTISLVNQMWKRLWSNLRKSLFLRTRHQKYCHGVQKLLRWCYGPRDRTIFYPNFYQMTMILLSTILLHLWDPLSLTNVNFWIHMLPQICIRILRSSDSPPQPVVPLCQIFL